MKLLPFILAVSLLPTPALAADKLNPAIEVTPCKTIALPDGGVACEPPKVSQAPCITVTVKEKGKRDRKLLVCDQSRPRNEAPQNPLPKIGGY